MYVHPSWVRCLGLTDGLNQLLALRSLKEEDRRTVELATEQMKKVISNSPNISVEEWEGKGDNLEVDFREVERRMFSAYISWGRLITFLAFSISFASYVSSRGVSGGVGSVFAWTNQALNTTLIELIRREDGWRGFIEYAEPLFRFYGVCTVKLFSG